MTEDLVFTVQDEPEIPPRELVRLSPDPETPGDFTASRDGKHLAYVCTHGGNGWIRVGFDWGQGINVFPTLEEAADFLSKLESEA